MIVDTLLVIISPLNPSPLVAATVNWPFSYIRLTDKPSIFGSIENGMLTPTLKLKRKEIINNYKQQLENLY